MDVLLTFFHDVPDGSNTCFLKSTESYEIAFSRGHSHFNSAKEEEASKGISGWNGAWARTLGAIGVLGAENSQQGMRE